MQDPYGGSGGGAAAAGGGAGVFMPQQTQGHV
jgi:hypothetical protein